MSELTLVLVVRDAAALLPDFLAHHRPLADELVVVDTGSQDGSDRLALAAGARLVRRAWDDDFAAARNAGLAAAAGDWILILDADERLAAADFPSLRASLAEGPPRVLVQETRNYTAAPGHLEWRPVRGSHPAEEAGQSGYFAARRAGLFPNRPQLRFSGRVHESILPAALALGLPVAELPVPVHHYGYVLSAAVNAARRARYRDLVRRKHEDDPADAAGQLEWATVLLEDGETARARALLEGLAEGPAGLRPVVRGLFLLGRLQREGGQAEAAADSFGRAVAQDPAFLFPWLELIRLATAGRRWSRATDLIAEAARHVGGDEPLLRREELLCLVQTGRLESALRLGRALLTEVPAWSELRPLVEKLEKMLPPADPAAGKPLKF